RGPPQGCLVVEPVIEYVGDELDGAATVIEDDEVGDETHRLPRHIELFRWPVGQLLDLANRFPADETDQATGERRVSSDVRRFPATVKFGDGLQRSEPGHISERA